MQRNGRECVAKTWERALQDETKTAEGAEALLMGSSTLVSVLDGMVDNIQNFVGNSEPTVQCFQCHICKLGDDHVTKSAIVSIAKK